jgi:hypothetical protein
MYDGGGHIVLCSSVVSDRPRELNASARGHGTAWHTAHSSRALLPRALTPASALVTSPCTTRVAALAPQAPWVSRQDVGQSLPLPEWRWMGVTHLGDVSPSCADDTYDGETDSGDEGVSLSSRDDTDPATSDSEPDVCGNFAGDGDASVVENQTACRRPVFVSLDGQEAVCARYQSHLACVCAVLRCSPDDAALLLRHFKWNVSRVSEEYFSVRGGPQGPARAERLSLTGPRRSLHQLSTPFTPPLSPLPPVSGREQRATSSRPAAAGV